MIKYFTIEDLLKHYLQKKFHILGLERRSQTLQVLLFILWVTSVGLHFPIDRFFRGFSEKAILSGI